MEHPRLLKFYLRLSNSLRNFSSKFCLLGCLLGALLALAPTLFLNGCAYNYGSYGYGDENTDPRAIQLEQASIAQEPDGDYFIGRRYYNPYYKFWGYVRKPRQQWCESKLVMMNEREKFAPDREINQLGSDNNCEYKLYGKYTGDTVYEPASDSFYPEFLLSKYEVRDKNKPSILSPDKYGTYAGPSTYIRRPF